ncbi:MAG: 3-hydroxyacyl-CoA dehydrogenase family protein, partial [Ignavibacteria bacterium]
MDLNEIKTIGVVGAGTMGSGIASISALSGFDTIVYDITNEILECSKRMVFDGYDKLVDKKKIEKSKRIEVESKLLFSNDLKNLSSCNLVIEAAIEKLETKKEIFRKLDKITYENTTLAT